nr:MAG TPA: hypothetical protein [Caudoviricetes sp.]
MIKSTRKPKKLTMTISQARSFSELSIQCLSMMPTLRSFLKRAKLFKAAL